MRNWKLHQTSTVALAGFRLFPTDRTSPRPSSIRQAKCESFMSSQRALGTPSAMCTVSKQQQDGESIRMLTVEQALPDNRTSHAP